MRPLIQKQQQNLKQNLSKFENRATQITYSLNKIQYLLYNNHESEQNREFIKSEYKFLQNLVAQVGSDLDAFQNSSTVLLQLANNNPQMPAFPNLTINNSNDEVKVEEEEREEINDKELNSQSNYDDGEEDEDEEYEDQYSQQKSNHHQGVITRKKNIEKDKIYSSGYQNSSNNRNNHNQSNNYSSSVSESQNYMGNSGGNKDYNSSSRQVRKKKYSSELRKKLIQEINRNNINYRKICKKYNINYGTAYYLINSIQKELGEQQQSQSNQKPPEGGNGSVQKSNLQGNQGNGGETSASNNNKINAVQADKSIVVTETGRNKYSEEFKQRLYVESSCGLAYKDISDKHGISYETCYYLINTIKNNAAKDHALNRNLKAQIAAFQEQLDQNKGSGSNGTKTYNSKINTIPTTTTLTRAQQAILNGTVGQSNEKKNESNTIAIDEEESVHEIDHKRFINLDEKINNNHTKLINDEFDQQKPLKVLVEEGDDINEEIDVEEQDDDDKIKSEEGKIVEINVDSTDKQEENYKTSSKTSTRTDVKGEQDSSLSTQKRDSHASTKVGGSTDEDNAGSE